MLEVDGLVAGYKSGGRVLDGVTISFERARSSPCSVATAWARRR